MLAAEIGCIRLDLLLPQDRNDLFFRKTTGLHCPSPPSGLYPNPEEFYGARVNQTGLLMAEARSSTESIVIPTSPRNWQSLQAKNQLDE